MHSLWRFIAKTKNRQVVSWVGGGIVAVAVGARAVVTYVWPHHDQAETVCAQQRVAVGGNVSGSTITNAVTGSSSSQPCVATKDTK